MLKISVFSHPLGESSDIQISAELNDNFEMRNKAVHKDRVNRVVKGLKVCFLNIRGLFKHLMSSGCSQMSTALI